MANDSGKPLTPAELTAAGEAIYGAAWKTTLGRDLGLNDSTMSRMAAGKTRIPLGLREEIAQVADRQGEKCRQIAAALRAG